MLSVDTEASLPPLAFHLTQWICDGDGRARRMSDERRSRVSAQPTEDHQCTWLRWLRVHGEKKVLVWCDVVVSELHLVWGEDTGRAGCSWARRDKRQRAALGLRGTVPHSDGHHGVATQPSTRRIFSKYKAPSQGVNRTAKKKQMVKRSNCQRGQGGGRGKSTAHRTLPRWHGLDTPRASRISFAKKFFALTTYEPPFAIVLDMASVHCVLLTRLH
jgi:hypothetical protein